MCNQGYREHVSGREGNGFIDPLAALEKEYEAALELLRREMGEPRTLGQKWRFWRRRRRLWRETVVLPRRSANW